MKKALKNLLLTIIKNISIRLDLFYQEHYNPTDENYFVDLHPVNYIHGGAGMKLWTQNDKNYVVNTNGKMAGKTYRHTNSMVHLKEFVGRCERLRQACNYSVHKYGYKVGWSFECWLMPLDKETEDADNNNELSQSESIEG